jgi:hypothetical protein
MTHKSLRISFSSGKTFLKWSIGFSSSSESLEFPPNFHVFMKNWSLLLWLPVHDSSKILTPNLFLILTQITGRRNYSRIALNADRNLIISLYNSGEMMKRGTFSTDNFPENCLFLCNTWSYCKFLWGFLCYFYTCCLLKFLIDIVIEYRLEWI